MPDQLYVATLGQPNEVAVPYHADMPIYQYLRDILTPALHSYTMNDGATVMETFVYSRPDDIKVTFARENRLDRLGDVVPPEAKLHRVLTFLGPRNTRLYGNATRGDITETCALCMEDDTWTDYELTNCAHRFHLRCMCTNFLLHSQEQTLRCPLCREPLSPEDEWGAWRTAAIRAEAMLGL